MDKKRKASIILNSIILIAEIAGFVVAIAFNGFAIMGYYTQESNFVLLVATAIYLYFRIFKGEIPKWVLKLKYVATGLVSVTFVVVVLVLIPMVMPYGAWASIYMIFGGANLVHHLTCPILSVITFLLFEKEYVPGKADNFIAMLPTLLYAIVTTSLNVAKVIRGPYPFLYVYEQPVWMSVMWFIVIPGGGYLLALILRVWKKALS